MLKESLKEIPPHKDRDGGILAEEEPNHRDDEADGELSHGPPMDSFCLLRWSTMKNTAAARTSGEEEDDRRSTGNAKETHEGGMRESLFRRQQKTGQPPLQVGADQVIGVLPGGERQGRRWSLGFLER